MTGAVPKIYESPLKNFTCLSLQFAFEVRLRALGAPARKTEAQGIVPPRSSACSKLFYGEYQEELIIVSLVIYSQGSFVVHHLCDGRG